MPFLGCRLRIFTTFGLCNFFLPLFRGDSTVESKKSWEVGLHKVPLTFWYNQPELISIPPKSWSQIEVIKIALFNWLYCHQDSFWKVFLWVLLIKTPNEKVIFLDDCCKPKKSSVEKCHFYDAVCDFHNFGPCNFFLVLFQWRFNCWIWKVSRSWTS